MYLLDVNVWVALSFEIHAHHQVGSKWFASVEDSSCLFCRMTQQGLLRLASNSKAMGASAVSLTDAWTLYDTLASDPRVGFVDEPPGVESVWRDYTNRRTVSPKLWTDAFLAAFAQVYSLELVTFDKAFHQYADLKCTILS